VKHWREEEEIFLTDQRDFEIGIMAFFELKRRVQTTEATAEDQDTSFCHGFLILPAEISQAIQATGINAQKWTVSARMELAVLFLSITATISYRWELPTLPQSPYKRDRTSKIIPERNGIGSFENAQQLE
jgi:hypothetical protein